MYVDDIFAQHFLEQINGHHPNIKFTIKETLNNVLSLLDTEIRIIGDQFQSGVYRKSTKNTDVLLNFGAVSPVALNKGIKFMFTKVHKVNMLHP